MKIELTTESPLSSYDIPIVRINGVDYGPADIVLQTEKTAAQFVIENIKKFLSQWPSGPKLDLD